MRLLKVGLWLAAVAIVVAIVGGAAWLMMEPQERPPIGRLALTGIFTVLFCAPWLLEFVAGATLRRSLDYGIYLGRFGALAFDLSWGFWPADWQKGQLTAILPLAALALVAGPFAGQRRRTRATLWIGVATFAVLAYCGGYVTPLRPLQPYRFVIPMMVLLFLLAAPLAGKVTASFARRGTSLVALAALVMLVGQVIASFRASDFIAAGLGPADRWALETIRSLAVRDGKIDGRILADGEWRSESVPGRRKAVRISYSFVGLSKDLDAEFIGAPAMATGLRTEYASFWFGKLFGRPITEYDAKAFRAVCDRYDVRWVLTSRGATRRHLESLAPLVTLRAEHGPIGVFEVDRVASRVASGPGRAFGDGRTIVFETDAAEPSVLKYHWVPGLRAEPAAELRSVAGPDGDPVGFVEIRPPRAGRYRIRWAPGDD